jgi:hypothetical protein
VTGDVSLAAVELGEEAPEAIVELGERRTLSVHGK